MRQILDRLQAGIAATGPQRRVQHLWHGLLVVILLLLLLGSIDKALQLPQNTGCGCALTTQRFTLTWQPEERDRIREAWRASPGMRFIVNSTMAIDALAQVPAYIFFLLATLALWSCNRPPAP